jgi:uncharacterized cupredoxin-like copper-binding protein
MLTRPRSIARMLLAVFILLVLGSSAMAQDTKSALLAKELAAALDAAKLTAIAAKDPSDPDAFVAAMYFSGSQLLVVGAKYSPAVLLNEKLKNKEYQEIYIDLNSAGLAGSKVFVEDPGADGIKADHKDNEAFDTLERGGKRTSFDDHWRKEQKLTEEQFAKLVADADAFYSRLLQALLAQVKK